MINLIVAVSKNGVIGKNNSLPWRIKEDLKKFKELTMGGILFVGKKTGASMPPLPGREVLVLDRNNYPTINDVSTIAKDNKTCWIAGGTQIFRAALELNIVDKIYLTYIDQEYDGDTFFSVDEINKNKNFTYIGEEVLRAEAPYTKLMVYQKNV